MLTELQPFIGRFHPLLVHLRERLAARLAVALAVWACAVLLYRLVEVTHRSRLLAALTVVAFLSLRSSRFLANDVVPQLMSRSRNRAPLKIWSAASSIGAEPYTLAMVLADLAHAAGGIVEIPGAGGEVGHGCSL